MNKEIKIGTVLSYISIFINILIGIVYTPWMINSIGKENYGLYTLAMSVIGIFVFDFGLGQTVTRFAAKYLAQRRQDLVDKLISMTFKLYLYADIFVFLLLICVYFFIPNIYEGLNDDEIEKFKIVYIVASLFSVLSFPFIPVNGIIIAYEKFIILKLCELLHKVLVVVLMSLCLWAGWGLYALVLVNAITGLIMISAKIVGLWKYTPIRLKNKQWDKSLMKEILVFSAWITVAALAQRCVINLCPSILGMVSDSENIAIFGVAIALESYVFIFTNAINDFFLPKVTRLSMNKSNSDILSLMIKVGRLQLYLTGCIIGGFLCVGHHFIIIWLGEEFLPVYWCTLLMILPAFITQSQQIGASAMIAQNKVKQSAKANVIKALTNLVIAYPLALKWGCYGIAMSIFISYGVWIIINNILFYRVIKIDVGIFFRRTYLKAILPIASCIVIDKSINYIISGTGWETFILKCLIFFFIYSFSVYFLIMNNEEKELMSTVFNSIKYSS